MKFIVPTPFRHDSCLIILCCFGSVKKGIYDWIFQLKNNFKERARQLRESQVKYREIVENSNDIILTVQLQGSMEAQVWVYPYARRFQSWWGGGLGETVANAPPINDSMTQPLNQMPGSVFHFTAWLGKAEKKEAKRYTPVDLANKKVLIVDDNQNNLDILTNFLESVEMRTVALIKGEDVVPILQKAFEAENPFDLCISDIQMPGMDGYDVAKQIRNFKSSIVNSQSSIRSIPLLALSSLMERDAKKCEEAGFDGFLSKPVRREKLYKILEKIIGKRQRAKSKEQTVR